VRETLILPWSSTFAMADMAAEFALIALLLAVLLLASMISYACLSRCMKTTEAEANVAKQEMTTTDQPSGLAPAPVSVPTPVPPTAHPTADIVDMEGG